MDLIINCDDLLDENISYHFYVIFYILSNVAKKPYYLKVIDGIKVDGKVKIQDLA